jgi:hypothetical protein
VYLTRPDPNRNIKVSQASLIASYIPNKAPISSQITFLRKSHGSRLNVFAPVNDLSALSKTGSVDRANALVAGQKNDVAIAGGQIMGDEWSDHVVKVGLSFPVKRSSCLMRWLLILESFGYHSEGEVRDV